MFAGLWLWLSPILMQFESGSDASGNASVLGVFIGALSMMAIATPQVWEEWAKVVLGIWSIASPWLLGFSHHPVATNNTMIIGAVVVFMSLWTLARRSAPQ